MSNSTDKDLPPDRGERSLGAFLYLIIVVVIVACLCGGVNLVIYGIPFGQTDLVRTAGLPSATLLIIVSAIVAAISGVLSSLIASWISDWVDVLPPNPRITFTVMTIVIFLVLISLGTVIALL